MFKKVTSMALAVVSVFALSLSIASANTIVQVDLKPGQAGVSSQKLIVEKEGRMFLNVNSGCEEDKCSIPTRFMLLKAGQNGENAKIVLDGELKPGRDLSLDLLVEPGEYSLGLICQVVNRVKPECTASGSLAYLIP